MVYFSKIYPRLIYDYWRRTLPNYGISSKGVAVLECGIGPGQLLRLMEGWFPKASLFGVDIDPSTLFRIGQSQERMLLAASAEMLPFPEQRFDFVISLHMIEHLRRPEDFLRETARVLRPEGILVLATPNPEGIGARLEGCHWTGLIPEHISLKSPDEWKSLVRAHGFSIVRDGTTGLSSLAVVRRSPLALINLGLLFIFGYFPWRHGEAYICIVRKK
jgi:ubiquinone/menaquinone biosynthesis C-methylase UbiE